MDMTKARRRDYSPGAAARRPTPEQLARRAWDNRLGNLVSHAQGWQATCAALGLVLLASLAGNVYLATRATVVPHLVAVDSLGEVSYRGAAQQAEGLPESVQRERVEEWLRLSREITSDLEAQRARIVELYTMLTPSGEKQVTEHLTKTQPLKRSREETVTIEIVSALRQSGESWQVDWRETTTDLATRKVKPARRWRARVRLVYRAPTNREQENRNGYGYFVDDFSWEPTRGARGER